MLAGPARCVSASELYSTDEVELLLDELRGLEPTSCRAEDVQDFEIAGSGCGGGGRSPAGTERSWDSHAQYRRAPAPAALALAPLYLHCAHLRSAGGLTALAVLGAGAGALACLWAASGARLPPPQRPLALAALTSLLLHAALLCVRVTRLHRLMPLDWPALAAVCHAWAALSLAAGAAALLAAPAAPAPALRAAAGLGCAGAAAAAAGAAVAAARRWRARAPYRAVPTRPPAPPDPPL